MTTSEMNKKLRLSLKDKLNFFNSLSFYVHSSVPMAEALELINQKTHSKNLKIITRDLVQALRYGASLADVLPRYEYSFSKLYTQLFIIGVQSGKLDVIVPKIELQLERERAMRSRIISALIYPVILLFIMYVVVSLFEFFIGPVLAISLNGGSVCVISVLVSAVIKMLVNLLIILFTISAVIWGLIKFEFWDKTAIPVFLNLPLVGDFIRDIYISNFLLSLKAAYEAGMPIASAFELSVSAFNGKFVNQQLNAHQQLDSGADLPRLLATVEILPEDYINTIATGEIAGKLGDSISIVLNTIDNKIKMFINVLGKTIEPFFVFIIGIFVLSILVKYYKVYFLSNFAVL